MAADQCSFNCQDVFKLSNRKHFQDQSQMGKPRAEHAHDKINDLRERGYLYCSSFSRTIRVDEQDHLGSPQYHR
jgi:hypothetical protein